MSKYTTGKETDSFHERVMKYIRGKEKEQAIEAIKSVETPFLETAYKEYLQSKKNAPTEYYNPSFQDYLQKRKDTVNDKAKQILIIPFQADSFFNSSYYKIQ